MSSSSSKFIAVIVARVLREVQWFLDHPDVATVYVGRTYDLKRRRRDHVAAGRGSIFFPLTRIIGHRLTELVETMVLTLLWGHPKLINREADGRGALHAGANFIYVMVEVCTKQRRDSRLALDEDRVEKATSTGGFILI